MKVIEQSYQLNAMPSGPSIIEMASRTCYKSEAKMGCTWI